MTYDQERLNDALYELESAQDRQDVLEQHLRERDALIANYERLLARLMITVISSIIVLLAVGLEWWWTKSL